MIFPRYSGLFSSASLELRCENDAFYILVYVLANYPLATRDSGRKEIPPPMRRILGVGGWVTKKSMAMQAEVLNQSNYLMMMRPRGREHSIHVLPSPRSPPPIHA